MFWERFRRGIPLFIVLAVSATAHWRIMARGGSHTTGDTASYIEPATSFLRTGSFTRVVPMSYVVKEPADPLPAADTIRTPGYPLFLALNRLDLRRVVAVQHGLDVLLAVLIYCFARTALRSGRAALVAALVYSLWLPSLLTTDDWMSDSLFVFVFAVAAGFACAAARKASTVYALISGLLLGSSVLIRPIALFFFIPAAILLAFASRRAAPVAVFLAAALALPAAWSVRNYQATGVATVSSVNAENLLFFRAGSALVCDGDSAWSKLTVLHRQHGFFNRLFRAQPQLLDAAMRMAKADGVNPVRSTHAVRARYFSRLAVILIAPRMGTVAAQSLGGVVELWITGLSTAASESHDLYTARIVFIPLAIALDAIAVFGLADLRRSNRPLFWMILAIAAYFTVLSACPGDRLYRFFAPIAPAFALAVGAGVERLVTASAALRSRVPRLLLPR